MPGAITSGSNSLVSFQDEGSSDLLSGKSQAVKPAEAKQEGGSDLGVQVRGLFDQDRGQTVYSMV